MANIRQGKSPLTVRGVASLEAGKWAADPGARGAGRLQVLKLPSGGTAWYFRYSRSDGRRDSLPLGTDLTLAQARQHADLLSRRYQSGDRDLRDALASEKQASETERQRAKKELEQANIRAEATLGALLTAYGDHLERAGKVSAKEVRKSLARHVETPWPRLWASPAADVQADELLQVVARLVEAGTLREAAKVRSFLRAAYSAAISARHDPAALPALRGLRISVNPARDLATIEGNTVSRERHLTIAELQDYWRLICRLGKPYGPLLRFHLLTGAQRIAQISRLTRADFDADRNTIRIYDRKGRRKRPREHVVPLVPDARAAMDELGSGPFLFSLTGGLTPTGISGVGDALNLVNAEMLAAGQLTGGRFTVSDIRRTVETRLSAAGVSLEDRAYLQSHGLGGVQQRHYDKHVRLEESRRALVLLRSLLEERTGTKSRIRRPT